MTSVSFGMIVLNGEPFLRYNFRALYPFARQIIVVEGAAPAAASTSTLDGHSTDGTLEVLHRLKAEEDPEDKLVIVTAEDEGHPDGFWPGEKDEQSRAYAQRATGDYLWQVDVDEFYQPEAMARVLDMVASDAGITGMSFKTLRFWGGLGYVTEGLYCRQEEFRRLFRWGPGYIYAAHRPPTVLDGHGRDSYEMRWIDGNSLVREDIFLFHYELLFPQQVRDKCAYRAAVDWFRFDRMEAWARDSYFSLQQPLRVHKEYRYLSWLERYTGSHPPQVLNLWRDIEAGRVQVELRSNDDIDRLLRSPRYTLARLMVSSNGRVPHLYRLYSRVEPWLR